MSEIHTRLKVGANLHDPRSSPGPAKDALESTTEFPTTTEDIPIFCAGGCGEVMGYVRTDDSIPTRWCAVCEEAKVAESTVIEPAAANSDELAGLRSPPRDLRKAHIVQVLAVVLIFAGSIYIAIGRPIGIYLAAIGILAWIAVGLLLWRLRN